MNTFDEKPNNQDVCLTKIVSRRQFFDILAGMGILAAGAATLSGCSSASSSAASTSSSSAEALTVVDAKGNVFTIPDKVERIAITCNGGTTHEVVIFGGADKIVAEPSMKRFPQLLKMYPQLNDVIDAGSFDDLNIETLVAQAPDIALVGISSDKGNAQIAEVNIPTYVMLIGWAAVDTLKQEFLNVGKILGNETKAQDLVAHWDKTLGDLEKKVSAIPQDKRKTVYYISAANITKANRGDWGRTWIKTIGADFAVPEENLSGDVTVELVAKWNPDVIIMQGGNDLNELYNNDSIKDLKAVKENQLYKIPIGGFWWDRPSPEATLGFLWLAQTVYPEYMKDIDLKKETKAFFKEFYSYDLSDEEYNSFF